MNPFAKKGKNGGKARFTTAPKKGKGKVQRTGQGLGGTMEFLTKKKPEQDTKPPTKRALSPTSAARNRRLEGVKL